MTSLVRLDYRKWPDTLHWQLDMVHLGEDEHGVWFGMPSGGTGQRGTEPPVTYGHSFVIVVPRDAWWSAAFNDSSQRVRAYVDINTPAEWLEGRVRMVDLDLDVAWMVDGEVRVLDEDEFDEHRVALGYPAELVEGAREACGEAVEMVRARAGAFAGVHMEWLGCVGR